jgi:hypothetical protein
MIYTGNGIKAERKLYFRFYSFGSNLKCTIATYPDRSFIKIKKPGNPGFLVIPPGFEPGTHSLEGCCSIQLSYGTIALFWGYKSTN